MRWAVWSAIPLVLSALAGEVRAQATAPRVHYPLPRVDVSATLRYERQRGAEVCPDQETFIQEVAAYLGYVPFEPDPERIAVGDVRVVVTRVPGGFAARFDWTGSPDVPTSSEQLMAGGHTRRDCFDAVAALAGVLRRELLLLRIKYGQRFAPERSGPSCPATTEASPRPACAESRWSVWPDEMPMAPLPKPRPDPAPPPERAPVAIRVGAAVWPEVIASGWTSLGLSAELGVRYRAFSIGVEVHGDPPIESMAYVGGGELRFARLSSHFLLCGHWKLFVGCGVGDAGRIWFPGHVQPLPPSILYGAAGARLRLEFPVAPWILLSVGMDLLAPINRRRFSKGGLPAFEVASLNFGLGFGAVFELAP
jgi:hypothetical protein